MAAGPRIEKRRGEKRPAMGVVYLAHEVRLDRPVVIKVLPPSLASRGPLRDRFLREARPRCLRGSRCW